jgi:hypothetical protein
LELWLGNHPDSEAQELHPMFSLKEKFRLIMDGEAGYNRIKERMALAYIEGHPGEFLRKFWYRVFDTWTAREDSRQDGWVAALHLGREDIWLCSAFSVITFTGILLAWREQGLESVPLALSVLLFPVPYYITHTALRYRHPIDPLMTIFAAYAVSRMWRLGMPISRWAGSLGKRQSGDWRTQGPKPVSAFQPGP